LSAEEDHDCVGFRRDEAKQEHILCTTVVAFEHGISEGGQGVKLNFLVSRADKMVDDMGRGGVSSSTAEPLAAS
jgi:hypothetical protein